MPDPWSFSPVITRERRLLGLGALMGERDTAFGQDIKIAQGSHSLRGRLFRPKSLVRKDTERGVLLHFHGGGFVFGATDLQDNRLQELCENTGLDVLSVAYRLAPECPYPCAPDDCEAAARWACQDGRRAYGWRFLGFIGENTGATLALVTALRLRDSGDLEAVRAMSLFSGLFDLNMTPSARRWGADRLVLTTRDIQLCAAHYLALGGDRHLPDVSPLYADLAGLPPTLVSVGIEDPLFDDSLFLATRLRAAGGTVQCDIYPHGCHCFQSFSLGLAKVSHQRIDSFLNRQLPATRA
ncbi:alpha/beta hydrolase [Polycladidibacter hongkongensis]|uniref:alpha/beta hydrolase n=1 Tax=Polycladidibacter hongkongensis TaxID=1647556 RepID=UPI001AD935C6|nr:alpha/beta hydrolase [Pseudovibrio hongkongensis]